MNMIVINYIVSWIGIAVDMQHRTSCNQAENGLYFFAEMITTAGASHTSAAKNIIET